MAEDRLKVEKDLERRERLGRIRKLLSSGEQKATLLQSVTSGNWSEVVAVIRQDYSLIDYKNERTGETAVHVAIRKQQLDILKRLLELKPKLLVRDNANKTPLEAALEVPLPEEYIQLIRANRKLFSIH